MSSIQELVQVAPFRGLPSPRFFYSNLDRLEVLAALRFGIEARKGITLFTGDAGTGKTSVLHELTHELNPKITCLLVSDPYTGFTDLLRLILQKLNAGATPADEAGLIRCCKTALRSRLETSRIVSLAFDDAQDLPHQTIESLTKHFLGKGFDPDNNLLQIILAGRPELRQRLFVPPLSSLQTQIEIECRLRELNVKEISRYIKHRLWAADLPVEIFDQDAVVRIALYSDGRPGPINKLCDRALQVANQSLLGNVTSEVVVSAAKDLGYREPGPVNAGAPTGSSRMPKPRDETASHRSTTVVAHNFLSRKGDNDRQTSLGPAERQSSRIGLLLILVVIGLGAVLLQSESAMNYVGKWGLKSVQTGGSTDQAPATAKEAYAPPPPANQDRASSASGITDIPLGRSEQPNTSDFSVAETEKSVGLADSLPAEKPPADMFPSSSRNLAMLEDHERQDSPHRDSDQERRGLAKQISKAIENRAILNVHVSVVDGIAYLDGRVATAQQRNAAERAARGVPRVREIRNRIAVE